MNRILFFLTLFIHLSVFSNELQLVSISDGVIYYQGDLSPELNDKARQIYEESIVKPEMLSINSRGGDVYLGLELAEWVFDNKLDIEVTQYCFSSCANYVFPAGRIKYLHNEALVGFHGGATSDSFDTSDLYSMYGDLNDEERKKKISELVKDMETYLHDFKVVESNFYNKINVNQAVTILGEGEGYDSYRNDENYVGWYYIPEDFVKLGIKNVIVVSPPWKLKQYSKHSKVFLVKVD
ncbi:peptidase [Shewanella halifaxensis]|uniref:peptidase n=1 Tax=Shewanella halifaxensis TaxID=271098 RepID=UPI000D59B209|nr:peptidase [Shewanella halifaxensis]